MTQTKRTPAKKSAPKKAAKKSAPAKKAAPRKPAAKPAAKEEGTGLNGKERERVFLVGPSALSQLPTSFLLHMAATIEKEQTRRSNQQQDTNREEKTGGEDSGSSTNFKNVDTKLPAMHTELLSLDSHANVLYGSLQRLNRAVTRAGGETLDLPPSMVELSEKEKPENMLAAAKLLNHKLNLINQSLNEHLNQVDHVI